MAERGGCRPPLARSQSGRSSGGSSPAETARDLPVLTGMHAVEAGQLDIADLALDAALDDPTFLDSTSLYLLGAAMCRAAERHDAAGLGTVAWAVRRASAIPPIHRQALILDGAAYSKASGYDPGWVGCHQIAAQLDGRTSGLAVMLSQEFLHAGAPDGEIEAVYAGRSEEQRAGLVAYGWYSQLRGKRFTLSPSQLEMAIEHWHAVPGILPEDRGVGLMDLGAEASLCPDLALDCYVAATRACPGLNLRALERIESTVEKISFASLPVSTAHLDAMLDQVLEAPLSEGRRQMVALDLARAVSSGFPDLAVDLCARAFSEPADPEGAAVSRASSICAYLANTGAGSSAASRLRDIVASAGVPSWQRQMFNGWAGIITGLTID